MLRFISIILLYLSHIVCSFLSSHLLDEQSIFQYSIIFPLLGYQLCLDCPQTFLVVYISWRHMILAFVCLDYFSIFENYFFRIQNSRLTGFFLVCLSVFLSYGILKILFHYHWLAHFLMRSLLSLFLFLYVFFSLPALNFFSLYYWYSTIYAMSWYSFSSCLCFIDLLCIIFGKFLATYFFKYFFWPPLNSFYSRTPSTCMLDYLMLFH